MSFKKIPGGGTVVGRNAWEIPASRAGRPPKFHIERNLVARRDGERNYFVEVTDDITGESSFTTLSQDEMVELFNIFLEMEDEYDENR